MKNKQLFAYLSKIVTSKVYWVMMFCLFLSTFTVCAQTNSAFEKVADSIVIQKKQTYSSFLKANIQKPSPVASYSVDLFHYTVSSESKPEGAVIDGTPVLELGEGCDVTWQVDIAQEGLYYLEVSYYPLTGTGLPIERELLVNGIRQFSQAASVSFDRVWRNEEDSASFDKRGNELKSRQVERPQIRTLTVRSGTDADNLKFLFVKGKNEISFQYVREPFAIASLRVYNSPELPDYATYAADVLGDKQSAVEPIIIEAEDADRKSHTTLYAVNDRTSPLTNPYHASLIRLNAIGGENWRFPSQWLEWDFDVRESGVYKLCFRARNDYNDGEASCRNIYIDGGVPFAQLKTVQFSYDLNWQVIVPGDENGQPYLIYLDKGSHTIRMENTLGGLTDVIRRLDDTVFALNTIYRKIVMITGTLPDANRDYQLEKTIPDMLTVFTEQYDELVSLCDLILQNGGTKSNGYARLQKVAVQLKSFIDRPNTVAGRLDSFRVNISDLASWCQSVSEQPLLLDYLSFLPVDAPTPKAEADFLSLMWHSVKSFFLSFFNDYSLVENDHTTARRIELWLSSGRDQAQIFKDLTNNSFSPENGIDADIRLVDMAVLLPAVASGKGPDVAVGQGQTTPVNYALRGALNDLSEFSNCDEVLKRFSESAITPFRLGDRLYALPETQTFSMMFYRSDILAELGIALPQTWDDLILFIPLLQSNNMEIGLPSAASSENMDIFYMLLLQKGGKLYNEELTATEFDSEISVQSFTEWCDFYTKYKVPQTVDAFTRFRTGEMPLIVTNLSFYNQLALAPEISGSWGFAPVPGTQTETGVNRAVATTSTGCVMFRNARDKQASWAFLDWWTRADTQAHYAREIESLQGVSGRFMTANLEAFDTIAWDAEELDTIKRQRVEVVGIPEVPGGYIVPRYLANSVKLVINDKAPLRDTLLMWNKNINKEIELKRKEFGLDKEGALHDK